MEESLVEVKANIFVCVLTNPSNFPCIFLFCFCIVSNFTAAIWQWGDNFGIEVFQRHDCWVESFVRLIEIIKPYILLKFSDFTVFKLFKIIGQVSFAHTDHSTDSVGNHRSAVQERISLHCEQLSSAEMLPSEYIVLSLPCGIFGVSAF